MPLSWDKSHSSKQSSPPSLEMLIRRSVPLGGPIWPKNLGSLGMYPIEVVKMVIMAKVNWKMEMETHSLWARIYCGKLKNTSPLEFPIFMENIIFIKLLWECWWPGRLIQKAFIKIVAKEGFKARLPFSYNKEVWSEKKKSQCSPFRTLVWPSQFSHET